MTLPETEFQEWLELCGACISGREAVGDLEPEEFISTWREKNDGFDQGAYLAWLKDVVTQPLKCEAGPTLDRVRTALAKAGEL